MKVSLVTRYPYLWHNITVTDDVNLKNSFLCYLVGDDFSGDLIFYNRKNCLPSFIWPQLYTQIHIQSKVCHNSKFPPTLHSTLEIQPATLFGEKCVRLYLLN
jgi:hypothetical protein